MIVVDASIFIQILLQPAKSDTALNFLQENSVWLGPDLLDLEVMNGIRKPLLRGELTEQQAHAAIEEFQKLQIIRFLTSELNWDIWNLRHNFTPYDATYILLAKSFEITLMTSDSRMFNAGQRIVQCAFFPTAP